MKIRLILNVSLVRINALNVQVFKYVLNVKMAIIYKIKIVINARQNAKHV